MFRADLIHILPFVTLLFFIVSFHRGSDKKTYLLFVLYMLPLMNLKVTNEATGGLKTFDIITLCSSAFLIKSLLNINPSFRSSYYLHLFLLYISIATISLLLSEFQDNVVAEIIKMIPIFAYSRLLFLECIENPGFYQQIISALRFTYILSLGFLIIQIIVGLKFTFYPALNYNTYDPDQGIRYPAYFFDSQAQGQFMAMGSFLFLPLGDKKSRKEIMTNGVLFILSVAAVSLSGSRSAFLGLLLGMAAQFILADRRFRIKASVVGLAFVIVYAVFSPSSGVFSRAKTVSDDYQYRHSIWTNAFQIAMDHPYFGIGSGNYKPYTEKYAQDQYIEFDDELLYFDQPENGYLKILVEFGIPGMLIFLLLIGTPLLKSFRHQLKYRRDFNSSRLFSSVICWMVAFNTVYSIFDYRILIIIATFLVLMIVAYKKPACQNESPQEII